MTAAAVATGLRNRGCIMIWELREGRAALSKSPGDHEASVGREQPRLCQRPEQTGMLYLYQGQLAAAEQNFSQGLTVLADWTQGGSPFSAKGNAPPARVARGALYGYLSVAPAAGVKSEDIYRHVLARKGIVEARQGEDRLARVQPELKVTLRRLERFEPNLLTSLSRPIRRASPGLDPAARRTTRPEGEP